MSPIKQNTFVKLIVILLVAYFYSDAILEHKRWNHNSVINHDVAFYYSYLPATFIYKDPTFKFIEDLPQDFEGRVFVLPTEDGKKVPKMSIGLSILYSPFFFVAHQYAKFQDDVKADGYTLPYSVALSWASLFYLLIALWLLMSVLEKMFSIWAAAFSLLSIAFASNLLYYTAYEAAMSHAFSFFLFALFIWLTQKWYDAKYDWKNAFFLGLVGGLITVVRPVNIIIFLLPLFYGAANLYEWEKNIRQIVSNYRVLFLLIIGFVIPLIPQLIFWKLGTGHWVYYSYQEQGFYFLQPKILEGLFSYRKGWLIYSPIMVFSLIGIFYLKKHADKWLLALPLHFLIHVYVIFSWWCWWYGGGFGARPMIELYALLSISLAAFIQAVLSSKNFLKILLLAIVFSIFIKVNHFQTWQYYYKTLIHWDSMTKEAYWAVFMKEDFPDNYQELIQLPDYDNALKGKKEYQD